MMQLIIGNKNYSSWSLRAWLMLKHYHVDFSETLLALRTDTFKDSIAQYSPAGKVPVLIDGETSVWDSLAICEYINEQYLDGKGWPTEAKNRALARAICCEMHAGFFALRNELPMNCRGLRSVNISPAAQQDIQRLDTLWTQLRQQHADKGPWLFGEFSIADAFYAPVALRFYTYGVQLSSQSQSYVKQCLAHPAVKAWVEAATQETMVLAEEEKGTPR